MGASTNTSWLSHVSAEVFAVLFDDGIEGRFLRLVSQVANQIGRVIQPGLRVD